MTAYPLAQDTNHVQESLALLTGQFASDQRTPNVRNMVRVRAGRTQDVENALWASINSQLLAKMPTGQALNQLGDVIGEARGTFNDVQYLLWILVAVRAHEANGLAEDAIQIAALALGPGVAKYLEWSPPGYEILALNIFGDYAAPLAQALSLARPPGYPGLLEWSDFNPSLDIVLNDQTGLELEGFTGMLGTPKSQPGLLEPGAPPTSSTGIAAQGFMDEISGQYPFKLIGAISL
jgi:hypothetical protein